MAGEEAPEKVRKMERKLQQKIQGDPGQRPSSPEPKIREEYQEGGAALPNPSPPPPSSWESSSVDSEATAENLSSGIEELMSQQAQMVETTLRLLAAVSEMEGGTREASPGLTEGALTNWLGQQEDRVEELMERLDWKQRELTRLAEVEEEDRSPSKTQSNRGSAPRPQPRFQ